MGKVVERPPKTPAMPLRCADHECRHSTFFVYYDSHFRCAKCGMSQTHEAPFGSMENELGEEIKFDPAPNLLNG